MPLHNPIGFGAPDFVELVIAALLVALSLLWPERIAVHVERFANKPVLCMAVLFAAPIVLRLALLPWNPIPTPAVSDDFSYVLLADTLRHLRLANPPHPMSQFFETFFVLQQPTYSSIFPLGQGLVIAAGWIMFGHPWAGVVLSIGALATLCYWMLRAWTSPAWALAGGVLCVIQFGPLNQWMNSYWGGAVSACAGCLVYGALPRPQLRWPFLGFGIALQLLTRPFESIFLIISIFLYWLLVGGVKRFAFIVPAAALGLILVHNHAITGHWTELPYALSRYQYGVPATFTFQPNPVPHRQLTREQRLDYEIQCDVHGPNTDTIGRYFTRLAQRVRFYRFFFLPPLYVALVAFFFTLQKRRSVWVVVTCLIFALGSNFYPYFYSHYIAAITCLFVYMSVAGLERAPFGREVSRVIFALCLAHFIFWYGVHVTGNQQVAAYETWDAINSGDPEHRIAIRKQLLAEAGDQLVFVSYGPAHTFSEWVHNGANIDRSRIVWARDLGAEENKKLLDYYPNRTAWLLEPDAKPPVLTRLRMRIAVASSVLSGPQVKR